MEIKISLRSPFHRQHFRTPYKNARVYVCYIKKILLVSLERGTSGLLGGQKTVFRGPCFTPKLPQFYMESLGAQLACNTVASKTRQWTNDSVESSELNLPHS